MATPGVESAVYDCLVFYRDKAMLQSVRLLSVQLSHPLLQIDTFSTCDLYKIHTHARARSRSTPFCPELPGCAGTRKVKPIWILLKQETVSGSGISWAVCKSAPRSRQTTIPAPHRSVFYRPDALPAAQPTASKH